MEETGKTLDEAKKNIWLVDVAGLVYEGRKTEMNEWKATYAHPWDKGDIKDLDKIVETLQVTAIIGVSGVPKLFTKTVCEKVKKHNNRPIIFPMSNPTSQSECTAEEAYKWTDNQCIFASGSPFPNLTVNGSEIVPAQSNNSYIFPGIALGLIAARSTRVTDGMFLKSAQTLASLVPEEMLDKGVVYPVLESIRDVSFEIAVAVAQEAYAKALATEVHPEDVRELIASCMYDHKNQLFEHHDCFDKLNDEFAENLHGLAKE